MQQRSFRPLPAELAVAGRQVLVVGGGPEALGRVAGLRGSGAVVTVLAAAFTDAITDLAQRGLIALVEPEPDDADGFPADRSVTASQLSALIEQSWLVVAATGNAAADRLIGDAADRLHRICLTADPVVAVGAERKNAESAADRPAPTGRVALVGGGPGDPGLLTVRGLQAVREADVVVVDRLAPLAVLDQVRAGAEIIDVAKIPRGSFTPQQEINRLLVLHARAGKYVVRLKGGDIFVFGRGGEEWQACAEAGIAVELVPGVSSALAAPALAGIPVTHRALTQGFTVLSGHLPPGDPGSTLDWSALARSGTTLIILMGVRNLAAICSALIEAGMPEDTPAAAVADAGLPGQHGVRSTVGSIAVDAEEARIGAPAVTVIGAVAAFSP